MALPQCPLLQWLQTQPAARTLRPEVFTLDSEALERFVRNHETLGPAWQQQQAREPTLDQRAVAVERRQPRLGPRDHRALAQTAAFLKTLEARLAGSR